MVEASSAICLVLHVHWEERRHLHRRAGAPQQWLLPPAAGFAYPQGGVVHADHLEATDLVAMGLPVDELRMARQRRARGVQYPRGRYFWLLLAVAFALLSALAIREAVAMGPPPSPALTTKGRGKIPKIQPLAPKENKAKKPPPAKKLRRR